MRHRQRGQRPSAAQGDMLFEETVKDDLDSRKTATVVTTPSPAFMTKSRVGVCLAILVLLGAGFSFVGQGGQAPQLVSETVPAPSVAGTISPAADVQDKSPVVAQTAIQVPTLSSDIDTNLAIPVRTEPDDGPIRRTVAPPPMAAPVVFTCDDCRPDYQLVQITLPTFDPLNDAYDGRLPVLAESGTYAPPMFAVSLASAQLAHDTVPFIPHDTEKEEQEIRSVYREQICKTLNRC